MNVAALKQYCAAHRYSALDAGGNRLVDASMLAKATNLLKDPQNACDTESLLDLVCAFAKYDRQSTAAVVACVLGHNPSTRSDLLQAVPRSLEQIISVEQKKRQLQADARLAHLLVSLAISCPEFATSCGQSDAMMKGLAATCCLSLQSLETESNRDRSFTEMPLSKLARSLLQTSYDLSLAIFACLASEFLVILEETRLSRLSVLIADISDMSGSQKMFACLENDFDFSKKLEKSASSRLRHDARLEYITATLRSSKDAMQFSPKSILLQASARTASKGKGKSIPQQASPMQDIGLNNAVDQVLDILPDQNPSDIKRHLQSPRFTAKQGGYDVEKLIAALLEGTLDLAPVSSVDAVNAKASPLQPTTPSMAIPARRNVFDDQKLDENAILKRDAGEHSQAMSSDVKRRIMALIEASEAAEREAKYGTEEASSKASYAHNEEEFEFEEDDWGAPIRIVGNQDSDTDLEDSDGANGPESTSTEFKPTIVRILSQAYLAHGLTIFERTKANKKSKDQDKLSEDLHKAGWPMSGGDDLLESWARMLDRDSNKAARLAPYEWAGNKPGPSKSQPSADGPVSDNTRGRGRGRGRVSGGKFAHDRRKRGHDKKMARAMPAAF